MGRSGEQEQRGSSRPRSVIVAFLVLIALFFTAPAFIALDGQRSALEAILKSTARERAGLAAVADARGYLLALERYHAVRVTGGEGRAERAAAHASLARLERPVLRGHALARRNAIVRTWAALGPRPASASTRALETEVVALSGAIADESALSFDSDSVVADFSDAVASGLPHLIDDLDCVAATTAQALRSGTLATPERLATALCLSSANGDINGLVDNDLELDASEAALEARVRRSVAPESQAMSALRQWAYDTLLLPASPLAGAADLIPASAALVRSHEAVVQQLAAMIDNRLAYRERKTRSAEAGLTYLYLAALLGGGGLVMLLWHVVGARDNKDLDRAQRRYREMENDLARARAEKALEVSEAQFRAVFDGAPLGIAVTDGKGVVVQTNEALDELLGVNQTLFTHSDAALLELLHERKKCVRVERQYTRVDGEKLWGELTLALVFDHDDKPQFAVGMLQDMTDRKQGELRLKHEASHDALTGLANRAFFMERLESLQGELRRHARVDYTLLYIDANKFKLINDTFGHEAGDHVLRTIADRLRHCTRQEDFIARLGGDEFVVLLHGVSSPEDTQRFIAAMHREMANPVLYHERALNVSVSIGYAAGEDAASAERVLREADAAMYQAKRTSASVA